jgi:hypothetical protein
LREGENKLMGRNCGGELRGKVRSESAVEAVNLAAHGQPSEVVYYPRASTPEFFVKASAVMAVMQIQWSLRMRFKMPFETEIYKYDLAVNNHNLLGGGRLWWWGGRWKGNLGERGWEYVGESVGERG